MTKYRVWNVINPPNRGKLIPVKSPVEGLKLIDKLTEQQLNDASIWGNAFGLEEFTDGEWSEWYSEDGEDLLSTSFPEYRSTYA